MHRTPAPEMHPAHLPPGTLVGPWRVLAWAGQGVHGAVYRAVHVEEEAAGPVALKLALLPRDPRFAREAELLSRLRHPSLPLLRGHGDWENPVGTLHPFLAMQWVEGPSLYEWAPLYSPFRWQLLRALSQLAHALHALHCLGLLHGDVKGENVLVRLTDARAILVDLGAGLGPDVAALTPPGLIPGTPAYRSPEAWRFCPRRPHEPEAPYRAGPADDLFALGVTACRLLTGEYPVLSEPRRDANGTWHLDEGVIPPAALLGPEVEPPLRVLILRMLSARPEERGTAAELAEALEQLAQRMASKSAPKKPAGAAPTSTRAQAPGAREPSRARGPAAPREPRAHTGSWRPWLVATAANLALAAGAWWAAFGRSSEPPAAARLEATTAGPEDTDKAGLGEDATSSTPAASSPSPSPEEALAKDTPPEPLPGQTVPDAKGHCPNKHHIALNGGCWVATSLDRERCEAVGNGFILQETCYVPVLPPGRKPTSRPTHEPR